MYGSVIQAVQKRRVVAGQHGGQSAHNVARSGQIGLVAKQQARRARRRVFEKPLRVGNQRGHGFGRYRVPGQKSGYGCHALRAEHRFRPKGFQETGKPYKRDYRPRRAGHDRLMLRRSLERPARSPIGLDHDVRSRAAKMERIHLFRAVAINFAGIPARRRGSGREQKAVRGHGYACRVVRKSHGQAGNGQGPVHAGCGGAENALPGSGKGPAEREQQSRFSAAAGQAENARRGHARFRVQVDGTSRHIVLA